MLGNTLGTKDAALSKAPAELVTQMKQKGLHAHMTAENNIKTKLPPKLMRMMRKHIDADAYTLPMGSEEAKEHRIKLMEARSAFVKNTESGWQQSSYSFCEH